MTTSDKIIKLAREAGFGVNIHKGHIYTHGHHWIINDELTRFAALIAAAEREACAKLCETRYMGDNNREDMEARRCAAAIRVGGQTPTARMCPSTYYECQRRCGDGGCKDFEDAHQRSQA